ncbi:hypothetical protein V1512DRAFT_259150 [Lipomyces arxii]|uniref:uncharacterized protein n=1 Tax=Lipomyces arxii TaxID=56418 RepID=UPI0034CD6FE7
MPAVALRSALASVPKRFPPLSGLHGRAALALASIDPFYPTKISIVPFEARRTSVKRVLDALLLLDNSLPYAKLADNEIQWHDAIKSRNLGKDSLIRSGVQLTETVSNFLQLYSVPSPFLTKHNIHLIESVRTPNSADDVYEPCHLYLFVSNSASSVLNRLADDSLIPALKVLDLPVVSESTDSSVIQISTQTAFDLLRTDSDWSKNSNLSALGKIITDKDALFHNLVLTIIAACEDYVQTSRNYVQASLQQASTLEAEDSRDIVVARKEWAQSAHTELRDVVEPGLSEFAKAVSWWKLYWVVDDLEEGIAERTVLRTFLPTSERSLVYVLGQLSSLPSLRTTVSMTAQSFADSQNKQRISKVGTSITDARTKIKRELLPILHWNAQKLVVSTFVLTQLPIGLLALGSWYLFGYTAYSMGGVGLFGFMLGFKQVQSKWDKLVAKFSTEVHDLGRSSIETAESEIYQAWESKVADLESKICEQEEVIDALKNNLDGSTHSGL